MSRLEKIICLSDFLELTRDEFESLEHIRRLADSCLDTAMAAMLDLVIKHLKKQGKEVYYLTLDAFKYYKR